MFRSSSNSNPFLEDDLATELQVLSTLAQLDHHPSHSHKFPVLAHLNSLSSAESSSDDEYILLDHDSTSVVSTLAREVPIETSHSIFYNETIPISPSISTSPRTALTQLTFDHVPILRSLDPQHACELWFQYFLHFGAVDTVSLRTGGGSGGSSFYYYNGSQMRIMNAERTSQLGFSRNNDNNAKLSSYSLTITFYSVIDTLLCTRAMYSNHNMSFFEHIEANYIKVKYYNYLRYPRPSQLVLSRNHISHRFKSKLSPSNWGKFLFYQKIYQDCGQNVMGQFLRMDEYLQRFLDYYEAQSINQLKNRQKLTGKPLKIPEGGIYPFKFGQRHQYFSFINLDGGLFHSNIAKLFQIINYMASNTTHNLSVFGEYYNNTGQNESLKFVDSLSIGPNTDHIDDDKGIVMVDMDDNPTITRTHFNNSFISRQPTNLHYIPPSLSPFLYHLSPTPSPRLPSPQSLPLRLKEQVQSPFLKSPHNALISPNSMSNNILTTTFSHVQALNASLDRMNSIFGQLNWSMRIVGQNMLPLHGSYRESYSAIDAGMLGSGGTQNTQEISKKSEHFKNNKQIKVSIDNVMQVLSFCMHNRDVQDQCQCDNVICRGYPHKHCTRSLQTQQSGSNQTKIVKFGIDSLTGHGNARNNDDENNLGGDYENPEKMSENKTNIENTDEVTQQLTPNQEKAIKAKADQAAKRAGLADFNTLKHFSLNDGDLGRFESYLTSNYSRIVATSLFLSKKFEILTKRTEDGQKIDGMGAFSQKIEKNTENTGFDLIGLSTFTHNSNISSYNAVNQMFTVTLPPYNNFYQSILGQKSPFLASLSLLKKGEKPLPIVNYDENEQEQSIFTKKTEELPFSREDLEVDNLIQFHAFEANLATEITSLKDELAANNAIVNNQGHHAAYNGNNTEKEQYFIKLAKLKTLTNTLLAHNSSHITQDYRFFSQIMGKLADNGYSISKYCYCHENIGDNDHLETNNNDFSQNSNKNDGLPITQTLVSTLSRSVTRHISSSRVNSQTTEISQKDTGKTLENLQKMLEIEENHGNNPILFAIDNNTSGKDTIEMSTRQYGLKARSRDLPKEHLTDPFRSRKIKTSNHPITGGNEQTKENHEDNEDDEKMGELDNDEDDNADEDDNNDDDNNDNEEDHEKEEDNNNDEYVDKSSQSIENDEKMPNISQNSDSALSPRTNSVKLTQNDKTTIIYTESLPFLPSILSTYLSLNNNPCSVIENFPFFSHNNERAQNNDILSFFTTPQYFLYPSKPSLRIKNLMFPSHVPSVMYLYSTTPFSIANNEQITTNRQNLQPFQDNPITDDTGVIIGLPEPLQHLQFTPNFTQMQLFTRVAKQPQFISPIPANTTIKQIGVYINTVLTTIASKLLDLVQPLTQACFTPTIPQNTVQSSQQSENLASNLFQIKDLHAPELAYIIAAVLNQSYPLLSAITSFFTKTASLSQFYTVIPPKLWYKLQYTTTTTRNFRPTHNAYIQYFLLPNITSPLSSLFQHSLPPITAFTKEYPYINAVSSVLAQIIVLLLPFFTQQQPPFSPLDILDTMHTPAVANPPLSGSAPQAPQNPENRPITATQSFYATGLNFTKIKEKTILQIIMGVLCILSLYPYRINENIEKISKIPENNQLAKNQHIMEKNDYIHYVLLFLQKLSNFLQTLHYLFSNTIVALPPSSSSNIPHTRLTLLPRLFSSLYPSIYAIDRYNHYFQRGVWLKYLSTVLLPNILAANPLKLPQDVLFLTTSNSQTSPPFLTHRKVAQSEVDMIRNDDFSVLHLNENNYRYRDRYYNNGQFVSNMQGNGAFSRKNREVYAESKENILKHQRTERYSASCQGVSLTLDDKSQHNYHHTFESDDIRSLTVANTHNLWQNAQFLDDFSSFLYYSSPDIVNNPIMPKFCDNTIGKGYAVLGEGKFELITDKNEENLLKKFKESMDTGINGIKEATGTVVSDKYLDYINKRRLLSRNGCSTRNYGQNELNNQKNQINENYVTNTLIQENRQSYFKYGKNEPIEDHYYTPANVDMYYDFSVPLSSHLPAPPIPKNNSHAYFFNQTTPYSPKMPLPLDYTYFSACQDNYHMVPSNTVNNLSQNVTYPPLMRPVIIHSNEPLAANAHALPPCEPLRPISTALANCGFENEQNLHNSINSSSNMTNQVNFSYLPLVYQNSNNIGQKPVKFTLSHKNSMNLTKSHGVFLSSSMQFPQSSSSLLNPPLSHPSFIQGNMVTAMNVEMIKTYFAKNLKNLYSVYLLSFPFVFTTSVHVSVSKDIDSYRLNQHNNIPCWPVINFPTLFTKIKEIGQSLTQDDILVLFYKSTYPDHTTPGEGYEQWCWCPPECQYTRYQRFIGYEANIIQIQQNHANSTQTSLNLTQVSHNDKNLGLDGSGMMAPFFCHHPNPQTCPVPLYRRVIPHAIAQKDPEFAAKYAKKLQKNEKMSKTGHFNRNDVKHCPKCIRLIHQQGTYDLSNEYYPGYDKHDTKRCHDAGDLGNSALNLFLTDHSDVNNAISGLKLLGLAQNDGISGESKVAKPTKIKNIYNYYHDVTYRPYDNASILTKHQKHHTIGDSTQNKIENNSINENNSERLRDSFCQIATNPGLYYFPNTELPQNNENLPKNSENNPKARLIMPNHRDIKHTISHDFYGHSTIAYIPWSYLLTYQIANNIVTHTTITAYQYMMKIRSFLSKLTDNFLVPLQQGYTLYLDWKNDNDKGKNHAVMMMMADDENIQKNEDDENISNFEEIQSKMGKVTAKFVEIMNIYNDAVLPQKIRKVGQSKACESDHDTSQFTLHLFAPQPQHIYHSLYNNNGIICTIPHEKCTAMYTNNAQFSPSSTENGLRVMKNLQDPIPISTVATNTSELVTYTPITLPTPFLPNSHVDMGYVQHYISWAKPVISTICQLLQCLIEMFDIFYDRNTNNNGVYPALEFILPQIDDKMSDNSSNFNHFAMLSAIIDVFNKSSDHNQEIKTESGHKNTSSTSENRTIKLFLSLALRFCHHTNTSNSLTPNADNDSTIAITSKPYNSNGNNTFLTTPETIPSQPFVSNDFFSVIPHQMRDHCDLLITSTTPTSNVIKPSQTPAQASAAVQQTLPMKPFPQQYRIQHAGNTLQTIRQLAVDRAQYNAINQIGVFRVLSTVCSHYDSYFGNKMMENPLPNDSLGSRTITNGVDNHNTSFPYSLPVLLPNVEQSLLVIYDLSKQ